MEAAGGLADLLGEPRLDVHVHVFEIGAQDEIAPRVLLQDLRKTADDGIGILAGNDALAPEHAGVGDRCGDVIRHEAGVEVDR